MKNSALRAVVLRTALCLVVASLGLNLEALAGGQVLRVRISVPVETYDWSHSISIGDTVIISNIMEGLFGYDDNHVARPVLAESFTASQDARHYVFKLKKDVKWSDGKPLLAQHFIDSWKRLTDPLTGSAYSYFFDNVSAFTATDGRTITIDLKQPCRFFTQMLTLWVTFPIRKDLIEKYGPLHWTDPGNIAVLGPFTPVEVDPDKRYVLKPNALYHGPRESIESVNIEVIGDDEMAIKKFSEGSLDLVLNPAQAGAASALLSSPAHHSVPLVRSRYLGFNTSQYPLSLVKVRQAIAMAIDFSNAGKITHRDSVSMTSFVPSVMFAKGEGSALHYDPVKAKALLAESGLMPSNMTAIELLAIGDDEMARVLTSIQEQLKRNLGLKITTTLLSVTAYRARTVVGDGGMYLMSWTGDYLDPDTFFSVFISSANRKEVRWKSKAYGDLVIAAAATQNDSERKSDYLKALGLLERDQAVVVPLYSPRTEYFLNPKVTGAWVDLFGSIRFRGLKVD